MELDVEKFEAMSSQAAKWNYSQHVTLEDLKMDSNFMWLLVSLICSVLWVVYITYYNSRLVAFFFTKMINKFYFQDENFKIGSLTFNALSGKVMFRDIVYINYDYTLRIQDGYLIFRWWRAYVPKDVSEDLSHSDTRLSIMLNGFELHVYNRCNLYKELEKLFELDSMIVLQGDDNNLDREQAMNDANEKRRRAQGTVRSEAAMARTWRDLIPVIKVDICSGRIVFGNRLIPTTLSLSVEEAHLVYSTKPPASRLDHLMHFVKAKAENSKVMLAPSPNYTGMVDDPPRYMGEGFVIMSSNYIELYFYMDEPGLVPDQPVLLQLANGDVVESAPPIWGIDIKCGKGTDFSYGPWADRQREHLFKFFFPPNYQNLETNPQPKPGDVRQTQSFDIRLSTLNEATIDILFSKNRETNAVHINIGAGSYLEVNLPWIVLQDGYTTKITGQLLHLDATTSLQYRGLAESETLEFTVKCHYPLVWNEHQCWQLGLTGCKATANLVYAHKGFFQDLMNDWSSKVRPDILHFVPYTWKISLLLKEFELITISNEYNWIDCSSTNQENSHIAFCGDLFDLSFDLPFVDFLPLIVPLKIWIQGEGVDMSMFIPEVNTSRLLVLALDKNMKLLRGRPHSISNKWRKKCIKSQGWIDCWSVPIVALSIKYSYHPVPPLGPDPQADITTPEKEEILLSPMRIPRTRKQPPLHWSRDGTRKFDPTTLPADKVSVELEIGPSVLLAYGSILRNFINLKENIFGEDQMFSDMQKNPTVDTPHLDSKLGDRSYDKNPVTSLPADDSSDKIPFDPRFYRPLDVTVSVIIHDIQAHLVKNCSESEPPCPVVLIERLGFEMLKGYHETKLQLLLSPSVLISPDKNTRSVQSHLSQGHLVLSSLQVRGHAMFSDEDQSFDDETIEYAWLIEVQLGQLSGRLTAPQLYHVITSLETFVLLVGDSENSLLPPNTTKICHHGLNKLACVETNQPAKYYCPTSEEIKYRMTRIAIDSIDIYIVENGTALQTWLSPIRLSICNLHGVAFETGVAGLLSNAKLKQYISSNFHRSANSNANGEHWLEVGVLTFGPLMLEAATSLPQTPKNLHQVQQKFLRLHDEKTKRLWFLWPTEITNKNPRCGCTGGCIFFGSNRNGPTFLKPSRNDLQDGVNMAVFKILDAENGEYGYGQSLLHENQLVFHTPPYNSLNISLQGSGKYLKTPSPIPSTVTPSEQRRSLTRRFSYTSVQKGVAATPSPTSRTDVPYARLIDSSLGLYNAKIDSDSKLNKAVLNIPQMESSVSDSKIALNCFNKDAVTTHQTLPKKSSHAKQELAEMRGKISESHTALASQTPMEDIVYKEVQRTVSINSENHSEAFFSAEEEMLPSRSSSLKNSNPRHLVNASEEGSDKCTPLVSRSDSTKIPSNATFSSLKQHEPDNNSVSSTSFISALSSQEDMTLVNLQQTNKPIIDSPLLMASYMSFLQQVRCQNWSSCNLPVGADSFTVSLFKKVSDDGLVYIGDKYLPSFEMLGMNNMMIRLVARQEFSQNHTGSLPNPGGHFNNQGKIHPYSQAWWDMPQIQDNSSRESDTSVNVIGDNHSAIFVRFRGDVNFMISPLALESFQRFIEAVTPVVANLHPITVLNHLHMSCIQTVENINVLKQDKYTPNWMYHFQMNKSLSEEKNDKCKLSTIPQTHSYEETISSQLQLSFNIPKINITLIQSSIIDDLVSLSSLDNIQELSCASLLSLSIENINVKYLCANQMLETIQIHYRPAIRALGHKKSFGIMKGPRSLISAHIAGVGSGKRGQDKGDPVYIETSQKKCEDTNIIFTIGKAHAQLRRLHVESPQLKDAVITGIPSHHSKVSFKCIVINDAGMKVSDTEKLHPQQIPSAFDDTQSENRIGYIMFECGLEGVSIKFSKHSQMDKNDGANDDKMTCKTESDTCYPESVRSCEDFKPDKAAKPTRSSGLDEIFKKKESTSSKPTTPNLNNIEVVIPIEPEPVIECSSIVPVKDSGRVSACVIDLKTVWFNFAAPPRTPITKKIDYTRLDWNLLSTASPAINAWMNPCNRLGIRVVALYRAYYRRVTATSASLMAAALDIPQLHMPIKSRYARQTPMASQLREEPSLQLCSALLRYALQADAAAVQADLADRHLPSLSTLRQGVIVLSRQWKNILYTPLLLEHNYKSKLMRPLNVKFALPDTKEEGPPETWGEHEEVEVLDENSMLLDMENAKLNLPVPMAIASNGGNSFTSSSPPSVAKGPPPPSNRSSIVFPILPFSTRKAQLQDDSTPVYGTLKEDVPNVGSNLSIYSSNDSEENGKTGDKKQEDLYSWMAKQEPLNDHIMKGVSTSIPVYLSSKLAGVINHSAAACSLYPLQDSLMLVEAHLIFQPFLSSLGVSSHQVGQGSSNNSTSPSTLDAVGSNLSLVAWMDMFRIDIVVSEFGKVERKKSNKSNAKGKSGNPCHIDIPSETPAFLCEKVGIDIDLKKIADMTVDDLIQRQNILYISRGQLKKHINTMLNFNLSIRYISQQVNMPLLRLLHQISNMYQNVKDTQSELRGQSKISRRQNKHTSSSASDFHENVTSITSLDRDMPLISHDSKWEPPVAVVAPMPSTYIPPTSGGIPQSLSQQKLQQSTNTRSRPQSFAQKLRSTGKSVKGKLGYSSLHEGAHTPMYTEDLGIVGERTSSIIGSLVGAEGVLPSINTNIEVKMTPRCWRTVYYLLDLYAAMPDSKTITHRFSIAAELPENYKQNKSSTVRPTPKEQETSGGLGITIVGVFRIHRTRLLASLSGLKLESEITSLHSSLTASKTSQWSLAGHLGRTMIVLLEGVAPNQQTVVRVTVGKSQTLYSSEGGAAAGGGGGSAAGSGGRGLVSVGAVRVDLPQHPVALHGVMTRSSRQLSTTLQELGVGRAASRASRPPDAPDDSPRRSPPAPRTPSPGAAPAPPAPPAAAAAPARPPPPPRPPPPRRPAAPPPPPPLVEPLQMQFSIVLQSLSITAALLPSLQAQYKMDKVHSVGVTGNKAHFTVDLPQHSLSFVTKLQVSEANLPSAASIALPAVHVSAQYVAERETNRMGTSSSSACLGGSMQTSTHEPAGGTDSPIEGVVLRQGSYLSATADIGVFEHSLSTDLLNHLVFVQKVFMKEVNEVVQKVYGGEKPVPLWLEDDDPNSTLSRILFSLIIRVKRIQLTATTPSNSAVRLETGAVEFQISNRVQNVSQSSTPYNMKLFAKVQVDVNLSLGQLIRNAMFEEADPEFQQYAFFNTRIALRNAFQDEMVSGEDKEVVLITLKRPLIYIQPMAVDKAILVWLNYKNAYEYWNEKRLNLTKEVLTATQQVFEKVQLGSQLSSSNLSTLFLQLTVDDMGICLPLNQPPLAMTSWGPRTTTYDLESRGAVVVTLESTSISACSSGSLVSKGRFVGLCLRFADDFETSLDDWKPDMTDISIMNLCSVSEGTYEVCSRTIAAKQNENAKWFLNVSWQMEGVDIHLDVNVGKQLSALGHTLTMLTGFEEEDPMKDYASDFDDEGDVSKDSQDSVIQRNSRKWSDNLPAFVFDSTIDAKKRSKLIEREMNEQAKIIQDLRMLGASHGTIEHEMKRLHELEALVFKDFRSVYFRDMIQKLRRQSVKTSTQTSRGKLGMGTNRSKSFVVPSSLPEPSLELDGVDIPMGSSLGRAAEMSDSGETLLIGGDGESSPGAGNLADILEGDGWSSLESSPLSGPSRSASLRGRPPGQRSVSFTPAVARQSSLPVASPHDHPEDEDGWGDRIDIQGESVQLRKKNQTIPTLESSSSVSSAAKKTQEPNIDFELDVTVLINRGKCVLHTKDPLKDEEIKIQQRMRKERSASGGLSELTQVTTIAPPSPSVSRKHHKSAHSTSHHARAQAALVDLTIFHIPGLDVKVHYESKTVHEEGTSPQGYLSPTLSRKTGIKKASLFAWMTLQSIPEETIISPHILEFLEQTLEPIPTKTLFSSTAMADANDKDKSEQMDAVSYGQYVYASFPVDVIVYFHMQPSTFRFSCLPVSRVECMLQLPSLGIVFSSKRAQQDEINPGVAMAGLSVTGCLADFSVYIFHPYGGKKSGLKEAQWSPLSDSERKDALSINVEFVKFHLSRSRKVDYQPDQEQSTAMVHFSTIVDIGSASFKYDMRRLTEILAFPKAWYRRSIVRRLFLGDLSLSAPSDTDSSTPTPQPTVTQKDRNKTSFDSARYKDSDVNTSMETPPSPSEPQSAAWETIVMFAVNFTKLNVHMNMGNVMGNVSWLSRDFHCMGRLNIGSTGHRNMYVSVGLGSSSLEAKGGIVGGTISLSTIDTYVHIMEEPGEAPAHRCGVGARALELRLDYMGSGVLMARVSSFSAALRDQWHRDGERRSGGQQPKHDRPSIILVHGNLSWEQLQLMISRSTTPDLVKMQVKLEEFFAQQFKSSKRVFSSFNPSYAGPSQSHANRKAQVKKEAGAAAPGADFKEMHHHRHWQKVLSMIAGIQLSSFPARLPSSGTVLGGTMELHGSHISLACFHGINFKSKSWALFSLKDPCISFATEAQQVATEKDDGEVHVIQSLTASLGGVGSGPVQHHSMATVCRMTRNIIFPPQFKTLREWFHYSFSNSEIDAVETFPSLERESGSMERERGSDGTKDRRPAAPGSAPKLTDPHHTRDVIFALPSLQLHLKTQHLQRGRTPTSSEDKPVVECSFITEFEDHIFVTVDAEAFFFLHDLISSYVREKERVTVSGLVRSHSPENMRHPSASGESGSSNDAKNKTLTELFTKDWRNYSCTTWHLEPTVRLLSWGGKSIEPYGVDYILQKLGFSHARTTIPKWLQRGSLDPLDKLLALILMRLVSIVPQK